MRKNQTYILDMNRWGDVCEDFRTIRDEVITNLPKVYSADKVQVFIDQLCYSPLVEFFSANNLLWLEMELETNESVRWFVTQLGMLFYLTAASPQEIPGIHQQVAHAACMDGLENGKSRLPPRMRVTWPASQVFVYAIEPEDESVSQKLTWFKLFAQKWRDRIKLWLMPEISPVDVWKKTFDNNRHLVVLFLLAALTAPRK